ncbi:MAG TPA: radical SAM protein [Nitrospirota bacterium]|nr:radical SAM protein [Nitrospirota bacterium]
MSSLDQKLRALELFIDRKEQLRKTTPLRYLFWESTLRCNLSCLHCGSDCLRDDASRETEIDGGTIKRELRSIAEQYDPGACTFAIIGGEPLLREDIIDVGAYAAELGYTWGITTNGMLLSRDMIKRLKDAKLTTISVSFDGVPADHEKLRNRRGSHDVVTTAIRALLEDRFFSMFDVICCVSKINISRLEPFLEDLIRLGIPAVRFTPVFSRGRAGRNSDLMLDTTDYQNLLRFIAAQRAKQSAIKITLSEEGYWGPEWECVVRDEFHYCGSGIKIGSILHDGRVTGCPSVSRKFIEGNIRETPFVDICKNRFARYRQDRRETFSKQCGQCEHWVLCEGGGFHLLDQDNAADDFCCLDKLGARRQSRG